MKATGSGNEMEAKEGKKSIKLEIRDVTRYPKRLRRQPKHSIKSPVTISCNQTKIDEKKKEIFH